MSKPRQVSFVGAGVNDSGILKAISKATYTPSKQTVPAGATWPFVKIYINEESIDFRMAHIHKSAHARDVSITLGKLGYVYFHSGDGANDFGFCTLKINTLARELRAHGYTLGESFKYNMLIAKLTLFAVVTLQLGIVAVVIIMAILRPDGV